MTRTSLDHHNCSFARTVDIIGDRWSLMILRDAFFGVRRFSQFKERLGITQAVLSARLSHLVGHELMERGPAGDKGSRDEYRLSQKGRELFPMVVALMQWGDRWIHRSTGSPIVLTSKSTGNAVDVLGVTVANVPVAPRDLTFAPGPGATPETIALFKDYEPDARNG